jgi:uncharacterized protein with ParB-like and HNH nuclease domain
MNVWKIATRWSDDGNPDSSILEIFRKYQVVFAGRERDYIRNQVKPGDFIALSDGLMIVSVGKVLSEPKNITDFEFSEEDIASEKFEYDDWVVALKVQIIDLLPEDVFSYRQGTFHAVHGDYREKVIAFYNDSFKEAAEESKFAIYAKTCTLGDNPQSPEDTIFGKNRKYIIPIYQRPYSWTEDQITKLISDIFKSYHGYDKISRPEPMFIGTMQLSAPRYDTAALTEQDIVDGQQRLSTFLILLKVLKSKFDNVSSLQELTFDWLETRVNNGEQQKLITEFLNLSFSDILETNSQNRYVINARLINSFIETELREEEDGQKINFSIDSFINHLLSNVYFVIIETHAGLSKTLQIFNAINTTGLDLNGGDVFKIRMYEYMRDKQKFGEEAFELISALYAKIDSENKSKGYHLSINQILSSYQNLLIARFRLPQVLYELGTETFFERLFDTVFLINEWKNFSGVKDEGFKLQLDEINELLDFHLLWHNIDYPTFEDYCSIHAIRQSRYSKHLSIIFLFLYRFKNDANSAKMMFVFVKKISKLFVSYSVIFDKAIGNMHTFVYSVISKLIDEKASYDEILNFIESKLNALIPYYEKPNREVFQSAIQGNIFYNHKKKNLLCRISAMLDEDYNGTYNTENGICNLFSEQLDIEHIESFNHKDETERAKIHEEWGYDLLNSLGNLMVLECGINRGAASNNSYEIKIQEHCYPKSKYSIVHKQAINYKNWNKENCETRKEKEVQKLVNYIFS